MLSVTSSHWFVHGRILTAPRRCFCLRLVTATGSSELTLRRRSLQWSKTRQHTERCLLSLHTELSQFCSTVYSSTLCGSVV